MGVAGKTIVFIVHAKGSVNPPLDWTQALSVDASITKQQNNAV